MTQRSGEAEDLTQRLEVLIEDRIVVLACYCVFGLT